ncbi:MAG: ferrochelatase, partial [Bacteroidota bacterium]
NLSKDRYSVSFQSRFAKKWLSPFTDELLKKLAGRGIKRILVFAPSFVTDCLETIVEINYEYKELFKKYGGEELDLVPSLNDSDDWADALTQIIRQNL